MYTLSCPGTARGSDSRCTARIVEGGLNAEGRKVATQRAAAQLSLLEDIWDDLEPVEAVFYSHDVPWQLASDGYVSFQVRHKHEANASVPLLWTRHLWEKVSGGLGVALSLIPAFDDGYHVRLFSCA